MWQSYLLASSEQITKSTFLFTGIKLSQKNVCIFRAWLLLLKKKKKAFILQSSMLKLIVLGSPLPPTHPNYQFFWLIHQQLVSRNLQKVLWLKHFVVGWFVQLCFGNWRLLILMIMFYSLTIAHNAIVGAVKLQFLMASKVSFVFSIAKATLLIMQ